MFKSLVLLLVFVSWGLAANDSTPPQLTAFSFSPTTIDVSTGTATVSVSVSATDDLSGVRNFQLCFLSPNGQLQEGCASQPFTSPGQRQSTGTANVTFPKLVQAGIWTVQYVNVFDEAGNGTSLNTSALAAAGFPTQLTVLGATPTISLLPTSIVFTSQSGNSTPAPQSITLSSTGTSSLTITTAGGSWLSVSPLSASTPATLSVSVNPNGLLPGTYSGSITITSPGASNSPITVPVSYLVTAMTTGRRIVEIR